MARSFGIAVGGFLVTQALGWKSSLGVPVVLPAMYGFPADFLLTTEVASLVGRDAAER